MSSGPIRGPGRAWWRRRRVWLGLAISAVFLVLLLRQVDGDGLRDALGDAEPSWLVGAFTVYLVALWLRAWRWRLVLPRTLKVSTGDAFSLVVIGYAANNILPLRAGELIRAELLRERHGADRLTGLGTIVVERVLDGLVLAAFLAGTVALAGGTGTLRALAAVMLAGFAIVLVLLLAAAARPQAAGRVATRLLGLTPTGIRPRARQWVGALLAGLTTVRGPTAWVVVTAATAGSWALEAAMYWLVGIGIGLDLDPALYLAVCGAANLAIGVPSSAGGIGPFEFFAREVVVAFGATTAVGTAYALALHALLLIPVVMLGLLLLWRRHISVRRVVGHALAAPSDAAETPRPPAPRTTAE